MAVNARLYLPREWTDDPERCSKAHMPDDLAFKPKTDIAIELLDQADGIGVPYGTVVFGSGYGGCQPFLKKLEVRQKHYVG